MTRWACLILVLLVLAACGSQGSTTDDRSFANNPAKQTPPATATPPPTLATTPTLTPTPPASPAALLRPRGAPSRFYVSVSGRLLVITGQGKARPLALPAGVTLLGFDWSPDGGQVAVAAGVKDEKSGRTTVSLLVLDQDGQTTRTVRNLLTLPMAKSTPTAASGESPVVLVDWGLVDNQIAVATNGGTLMVVPAKGEPRSIPLDSKGQVIRAMRISPRGDAAAILIADAAGRGSVATVSLTDGKPQLPKPLVGFAVDNQHSITGFAWLSDSEHLLYTQTEAGGDPLTGGELYLMNIKTKDRRLIDTGGRAGPSAGIVSFAPAPDGKSVAYVIGIAEGTTWIATSLWVRSLRSSAQIPVSIGNAQSVDGLWWTPNGLVWAVRSGEAHGSYQMVFFQQPADGAPHELVRVTVKRGTPATPAATPLASPVASPIATPSASPVATPRR